MSDGSTIAVRDLLERLPLDQLVSVWHIATGSK